MAFGRRTPPSVHTFLDKTGISHECPGILEVLTIPLDQDLGMNSPSFLTVTWWPWGMACWFGSQCPCLGNVKLARFGMVSRSARHNHHFLLVISICFTNCSRLFTLLHQQTLLIIMFGQWIC